MSPADGFTLIELLIVVSIMGIMAVGGYPLLMGYAQEVRLEQEARAIYDDLCLLREAGASAGQGSSTITFYPGGGGGPGNPYVEYDLLAADGTNLRQALMDGFDAPSGRWRRHLATHSVCLVTEIPNPLPGSQLSFNADGILVSPANQQVRLQVKFFVASAAAPIQDEVGTWTIDIATNSSQIQLRQAP